MNSTSVFSSSRDQEQQLTELFRRYGVLREAGEEGAAERVADEFLNSENTEVLYVPVNDGEIRVLHHVPAGPVDSREADKPADRPPMRRAMSQTMSPKRSRPVVFLPGWGTIPEGFAEFLDAVYGQAECYYLETREKNSSRIDRRSARMDMDQLAEDVQVVMDIAGPDSVLMGTCWGSTIIAHGLARGILSARTVVLFDPMYALWFPKWLLNYVVPVVPLWLWKLIKPFGKRIALWGMKEPVQRARAELFIDNADLWKWKQTALQVREVNLYDSMVRIRQEVLVMNGVKDKIHDRSHYPQLAALAPKGRFFYLPVDENLREKLLGLVAVLYAAGEWGDNCAGLPEELRQFERPLE